MYARTCVHMYVFKYQEYELISFICICSSYTPLPVCTVWMYEVLGIDWLRMQPKANLRIGVKSSCGWCI